MDERLRITEIFHSLQGETRSVGRPATFVRLTGCPLRCHYCDTAYAFHGGEWQTLDVIMDAVRAGGNRLVVVTGGEPLAQQDVLPLMTRLCDSGYEVFLETSGALSVEAVDPRVIKVLDLKTPDSGESDRNLWENLVRLNAQDQIKFVICSRRDYDWAKEVLAREDLSQICEVLFSPSQGEMPLRDLADWILTDQLPVRLQIQLHKLIWGDVPGR
ncbi:7-carboxy-7-deazaguanine synthase QueE [Acidithiobacillus thiooxidans]|jgi:7-carboxy-7-deazaguanine synthase|uniref:7-carboxy-7-deazaguanine synthase n=1 Tax=Acidithiobacillus thiooxidans ATCC 19377 TaxID=637390 RepID=A0A543Q6U5_ACITH|nr:MULTISPECIES: 7-carboxy-7-deazaguanine synthase QueE [Acidithiobacillus]MBU2741325.1 7-carboxy-7-deazaguanine synthase QueE [Acidithiobacillus albertensis]MBU2837011.1 7-carboxy-7-deazaguanine synthase QueE [Acidithiobacillus thiooxidans]MBU2839854.1 7-carboxy-7-deazaguanine synthase QueE [Acidithiobacillus thiooxidans]MDA8177217.1 7-carboxy-7-deazaguanine synthase QueE [Acidithiobacillus sp.]MDX5933727.1 7-carboxy-7-deazaguanine synthase QueE [Acidithiobacillus thiooxidans]